MLRRLTKVMSALESRAQLCITSSLKWTLIFAQKIFIDLLLLFKILPRCRADCLHNLLSPEGTLAGLQLIASAGRRVLVEQKPAPVPVKFRESQSPAF